MREIKFRAKGDDEETKNRWFYGGYAKLDETTYCFKEDYDMHPENTHYYIIFEEMTDWGLPNRHLRASVNPETIGQYTGLKDKNGVEIYEGDIIKINVKGETHIGKIIYEYNGFDIDVTNMNKPYGRVEFINYYIEVIGNIYDNPELLEKE